MKRLWMSGFGILAGVAIVFATLSWTIQKASSERDATQRVEAHTREVQLAMSRTLSFLQDAETGQRGYLLTGRPAYLEPYETGRASAAASLDRLDQLTSDDAAQKDHVSQLRTITARKLAELAETVALMGAGNQSGAIAVVSTERGRDLMDEARRTLSAIGVEQARVLNSTKSAAVSTAKTDRYVSISFIAAGIGMLLATVAAAIRASRSAERRQLTNLSAACRDQLRQFVDRAPGAIAMFDTDMRYLAANHHYISDYGLREVQSGGTLTGRGHYEVFPEIPERWRALHRQVLAGETCQNDNDIFRRKDGSVEWVRWEMTPWFEADGAVGGAILFSEVVTSRKQSERLQAFRLDLADRLQAAPRDAVAAAVALLGNHLKVSRAGYGEVDDAARQITVPCEFTDGTVETGAGPYRLAAFGPYIQDDLQAGQTFAVADVVADPRTRQASGAYLAIGARSILIIPLMQEKCLRATLYVTHHDTRVWTPDEISLLEEVAARLWSTAEQARAKEALERTVEEFQTLAEGIPTLCWMADPEGDVYWYNRRWYEYTGTQPADMEGWGWQAVHDPMVLPLVTERWRASLATGEPFEMTFPLLGADGVFRPFMTRVAPVRGENGKIRRWLGVNTDVAEAAEREAALHQAATDLRDSETRLQVIFDTAPVGIIIAEAPSGRIIRGNQQAEAIFRHPVIHSPTIHDYNDWVSFHPDGRRVAAHEYPLARALAGDERPELEVLYQRGDGTRGWVRLVAAPIRDADTIAGAAVVVLDIDRKTRALEALAEARSDLERRVGEETRARQAALAQLAQAEKLTALGQLAGGIAHDFNNVMQAVSGGAALIKRHAGERDKVDRIASMVGEAARRGASVTRRLLAFARRDELRAELIDVSDLLNGLQEVLTHTLGSAVVVRIESSPRLSAVLADRSQLETVLVNLATNARDAMPAGGMIVISATAAAISDDTHPARISAGQYVSIAVTDTDLGMNAEILERVLEPFFTTKEQGKGTGLGLSMARGFAEQSGGGLTIGSEPDRGAIVTLWLPAVGAEGIPAAPAVASHAPADRESGPRLLLVDDEVLVREMLAEELIDRGFDVAQAENGDMALSLLKAGEPMDILVSDLTMPGMSGVDLIRAVQALRPRLPAILLTGYAGDAASLAMSGAISGSFSLLRKPVTGAQLVDRVETLLEAAKIG